MTFSRLALLALLLFAAVGCGTADVTPQVSLDPPEEREPLGPVSVPALDGSGPLEISANGRPLVLNFWASWCGPCRAELPDLQALSAERDVTVVGLLHDDVPGAARAFADELGVTFPLGDDSDDALYSRFQATGLPITVFVDADGRVASRWFGPLDRETLDAFVDQLA